VLPPAWGVSLRALTDDLELPTLSLGGPATRMRCSDRIAGICHSAPRKNTTPVLIDLTKDDCGRRGPLTRGGGSLGVAIRGPLTRGGGSLGSARKGPLTRGGAATSGTSRDGATRGEAATGGTARGGTATGGAATGGTARGGSARGSSARGGANASSSSNQPKGKQIVTTVEKGIEIMEAKRKRKNPDWKP
jgi:hypothetical protein